MLSYEQSIFIYSPDSKVLGDFTDSQEFWEFPRFPGILGISQIPRNFGNFPDSQAFREFLSFPGIWRISHFDHFLNCCLSRFLKFGQKRSFKKFIHKFLNSIKMPCF